MKIDNYFDHFLDKYKKNKHTRKQRRTNSRRAGSLYMYKHIENITWNNKIGNYMKTNKINKSKYV